MPIENSKSFTTDNKIYKLKNIKKINNKNNINKINLNLKEKANPYNKYKIKNLNKNRLKIRKINKKEERERFQTK